MSKSRVILRCDLESGALTPGLGRKSGVLSLIADNWLKSAPKELKPSSGRN